MTGEKGGHIATMTPETQKKTHTLFPFLDLKAQYAQIRGEIEGAVSRVFENQHFILGPEVEQLEEELARYVGTQFAIGCASGSDAPLLLAPMALGNLARCGGVPRQLSTRVEV